MSKETNLDFDGMAGTGVNRTGNKYSGNQQGLEMKDNYGRGPTKAGLTGKTAGAPTATGGKISGGATAKCPANADKINAGLGPRVGNK